MTEVRMISDGSVSMSLHRSDDDDVSYLDRLQDTGISVLHSIFPFSHFWCPEMVPGGFSVMILYLRHTNSSLSFRSV